MVKMEGKAVVIGSLNYDIILKTDRMPYKGETHQAKSAEFCCGGKGGNQAVQCARLGIKTYMAGNVGMDVNGLKLLEGLQKYGVDTEFVKRRNGSSGMGVVHTPVSYTHLDVYKRQQQRQPGSPQEFRSREAP